MFTQSVSAINGRSSTNTAAQKTCAVGLIAEVRFNKSRVHTVYIVEGVAFTVCYHALHMC